ncbi:M14 family zinc carboxypeptidase [Robiginitalea sp. IMCC44478]|uniref:M14 family zinc carboxypeptidase n=1 Tax=Robiginitalea sp. IMCC44478 TaxID=3459122 RepID=UPI00404108F1
MKHFFLIVSLFLTFTSTAQKLQSPAEFLGYELGTQFTRHHEVLNYYNYVAKTLPEQVQLQSYGKTYERRPLMLATLSSRENMARIDEIRAEHMKGIEGAGASEIAIVWLSYNVHGNESVSTEASMQTLYELLTSKKGYLENTVVIMDPCINPDGRDRYVNWYNQYKNTPFQVDPNSREHHEGWWSGRSNHYMFDLNRDWAWLTQTESRQRLQKFNQWYPHIHVDFHEQGVDDPYYFAPAAEPYHEVISDFQREFQETIGRNHARYFDAAGWFYFTKEVFDLFYPSYGDTYPTYNGAIGMTYEQGGSGRAGLAITTSIGDTLSLKDRLEHHLTTGLSTVEVASGHARRLTDEFRAFYKNLPAFKYRSYALNGNPGKIKILRDLLDRHQIEYGRGVSGTAKGFLYRSGKSGSIKLDSSSLIVSTDQKKGRLVKVLFEPNARLSDSLTYDITAWSLPYAYGLESLASENVLPSRSGSWDLPASKAQPSKEKAYAYLAQWGSMEDARFLASLLNEGIRVRRTEKPFKLEGRSWEPGTLIISSGDNKSNADFTSILYEKAANHGITLTPTPTGFVDKGKDFGSDAIGVVKAARVAALSGEPVSTLRFGEVWHFFEQQLGYPLTVLGSDYIDRVDLSQYDILILPSGYGYGEMLNEKMLAELKSWVAAGGRLIAMGSAIGKLGGEKGFKIKTKEPPQEEEDPELLAYSENQRERIRDAITGAIFRTRVDNTHPLAFGYPETYFSLKLGNAAYEPLKSGTVVHLDGKAGPVAGFAGSNALDKIPNSLIYGVENYGRGEVVYMVDNPLFRGFWEGGKLFFANALFMLP